MNHKKTPFSFREIDLSHPPDWFEEVSPMGKVPLLLVDGVHAIFESAVINEYIDEVTEPKLLSLDPLTKATDRSWIEFGSELIATAFELMTAQDMNQYLKLKAELFDSLSKLEAFLDQSPFFRGSTFSLVDASYAPLFIRLKLIVAFWEDLSSSALFPKIERWAIALLNTPSVQASIRPDFERKMFDYLSQAGSVLMSSDFKMPGTDANHDTPGVISS
jgi:glutathione S-transferase